MGFCVSKENQVKIHTNTHSCSMTGGDSESDLARFETKEIYLLLLNFQNRHTAKPEDCFQ